MRRNPSFEQAPNDDGGVWLNFAKLLIPLAFICVWIFAQLGVNPFKQAYVVIFPNEIDASVTPELSQHAPRPGNVATQQVWFTNPIFSITFLPLAVSKPFQSVQVGVLEVWRDSRKEYSNPDLNNGFQSHGFRNGFMQIPWLSQGSILSAGTQKAPLYRTDFDLRNFVKQLKAGTYAVKFAVVFLRDGRPVDVEPKQFKANAAPAMNDAEKNTVWLQYHPLAENCSFGDFPVVRGQWFDEPLALQGKEFNLSEPKWLRRSTKRYYLSGAALAANKRYEQRGFYMDRETAVECALTFVVLENQRPRATQSSNPQSLTLFGDWLLEDDQTGIGYFNLSQFIIDPDGRNEQTGALDIRARLQGQSGPLEVIDARDGTRDYWLVGLNNGQPASYLYTKNRIINPIPRQGQIAIEVKASDESSNQTITVKVVR